MNGKDRSERQDYAGSVLRAIGEEYEFGGGIEIVERHGGTAGKGLIFRAGGKQFLARLRSREHSRVIQTTFEHRLLGELAKAGVPVAAP
ncbi:MAG: hypothetical protein V2A58_11885, partial [Planctomycetota bacterium]